MSPASSNTTDPEVILFTDGACSGNPGPGGWAFVLRHPASQKELVRSGGEPDTTNNRMEMQAVIEGLSALTRPTVVELISDSSYVGDGMMKWMPKWKQNGWRRKAKNGWAEVKNEDLWRKLDELLGQHTVHFTHVRGHSGHPENEQCDQLAVEAYQKYR